MIEPGAFAIRGRTFEDWTRGRSHNGLSRLLSDRRGGKINP